MAVLTLVIFFLLAGCGGQSGDSKDRNPPTAPPSGPPGADGGEREFQLTVKPVLDANCALSGCHAGWKILQTGNDFKNSKAPLRVLNNSMPPPSSPIFDNWGPGEKKVITDWISDHVDL